MLGRVRAVQPGADPGLAPHRVVRQHSQRVAHHLLREPGPVRPRAHVAAAAAHVDAAATLHRRKAHDLGHGNPERRQVAAWQSVALVVLAQRQLAGKVVRHQAGGIVAVKGGWYVVVWVGECEGSGEGDGGGGGNYLSFEIYILYQLWYKPDPSETERPNGYIGHPFLRPASVALEALQARHCPHTRGAICTVTLARGARRLNGNSVATVGAIGGLGQRRPRRFWRGRGPREYQRLLE